MKSLDIQGEALKVFQDNIGKSLEGYLTQADLNNLNTNVQKLQELLSDEYVGKLNDLVAKEILTKDEVSQAIKDSLTARFDALNEQITTLVGDQLSTLELFVNKKLTSIVLKPNFYWEGIEGIEAPFIYQTPVFEEKGDVEKDDVYTFKYKLTSDPAGEKTVDVKVAKYMTWKGFGGVRELGKYVFAGPNAAHANFPDYTISGKSLTYSMIGDNNKKVEKLDIMYGAVARYNLNPSIADIEGATIGFYENSAPVYTRATGSIDPKVVGTPKPDASGLLVVPFTVDKEAVMKYFVDWTNSQTVNWEGKAGADLEDWTKLWYYTSADKSTWKTGIDDKDAANDANIFNENLPFVSLKIDVPVNEKKGVKEAYTVNSDWAVVVPGLYQIVAFV